MKSILSEKFLKEMGSGKLHKCKNLKINIDKIIGDVVYFSITAENKFGTFSVSDNCEVTVGGVVTVECSDDFKIKRRMVLKTF